MRHAMAAAAAVAARCQNHPPLLVHHCPQCRHWPHHTERRRWGERRCCAAALLSRSNLMRNVTTTTTTMTMTPMPMMAMMASLGRLQNELFVLLFTLFLGQIGFLSQTASSQSSQHGKESLDKGICTYSDVMLSNRVRVGWVGCRWPHLGKRIEPHWQILVWPQTLACFFSGTSLYFVLCPRKIRFFFWWEMSI